MNFDQLNWVNYGTAPCRGFCLMITTQPILTGFIFLIVFLCLYELVDSTSEVNLKNLSKCCILIAAIGTFIVAFVGMTYLR